MEQEQRIQKFNMGYLLGYILIPALIVAAGIAAGACLDIRGYTAVVLFLGLPVAAVLWWSLAGSTIYHKKQKLLDGALDAQGFVRNHTFQSRGCTVAVDAVHGKLALLFFWNPFCTFVLPANRITRAWVDDGKGGAGFLQGSSRVSFLFTVDGVTVRVNTFASNKRWRMDSDYILTGISKADMMVEVLNAAREQAV